MNIHVGCIAFRVVIVRYLMRFFQWSAASFDPTAHLFFLYRLPYKNKRATDLVPTQKMTSRRNLVYIYTPPIKTQVPLVLTEGFKWITQVEL